MNDETASKLRLVRLVLSGGIVGAALVGIIFPSAGIEVRTDLIGAGLGAAVAGVLVKLAHLI